MPSSRRRPPALPTLARQHAARPPLSATTPTTTDSSSSHIPLLYSMEMSSPLAAMHPPSMPGPWGYRRDLPTSKPLFAAHSMGSQNFNFRDMSMGKGGMDYFNMQPMRDSSPTSSLAADMSSNLHVDQRFVARPCIAQFHYPAADLLCLVPSLRHPAARSSLRICFNRSAQTQRVGGCALSTATHKG